MNFRARMILTQTLLITLPLLVLGGLLRDSMSARLGQQYDQRVEAMLAGIATRLETRQSNLSDRLAALRRVAETDQALLLALAGLRERTAYPDDFIETGRRLSGLDLLVLLEPSGTVLASSTITLPAGRPARLLCRALVQRGGSPGLTIPGQLRDLLAPDAAEKLARTPTTAPLSLVALDSLRLGGRTYYLLGGLTVDRTFITDLSGSGDLSASLVYDGGAITGETGDLALEGWLLSAGAGSLRDPHNVVPRDKYLSLGVPFPAITSRVSGRGVLSRPPLINASLVLTHPRASWYALLRDLDIWLLGVLLMLAIGTIGAALIAAARITRPLSDLARGTETIDLETLDTTFPTKRSDEIGALARYMDAMQTRLRSDLEKLRESERRAALGDLARQVNHDIRNGFLPLRNVIRHLQTIAETDPQHLAQVFHDRLPTLETSLKYLEDLAGDYRRISATRTPMQIELGGVVLDAISGFPENIHYQKPSVPLMIRAEKTALRRIIQNLLRNALDSLDSDLGRIDIEIDPPDPLSNAISLCIRDNGCGMSQEVLEKATDQFFTTRENGTGLGLTIAQRLMSDYGHSLAIESEAGQGTTVKLVFTAYEGENP